MPSAFHQRRRSCTGSYLRGTRFHASFSADNRGWRHAVDAASAQLRPVVNLRSLRVQEAHFQAGRKASLDPHYPPQEVSERHQIRAPPSDARVRVRTLLVHRSDDEPCFQFGRHPSSFVLRSARLRVPSRTSLLTRTASAIWMSAPFEGHADVVVFCNLNATEYGQARLFL